MRASGQNYRQAEGVVGTEVPIVRCVADLRRHPPQPGKSGSALRGKRERVASARQENASYRQKQTFKAPVQIALVAHRIQIYAYITQLSFSFIFVFMVHFVRR
jgi:hypothetical protein